MLQFIWILNVVQILKIIIIKYILYISVDREFFDYLLLVYNVLLIYSLNNGETNNFILCIRLLCKITIFYV